MKVLFVDDDDDLRELAQLAFATATDIEFQSAASGREALTMLEGFAADVVLSDSSMPGMDGADFLARMRSGDHALATPLIFVTAHSFPNEIQHLLNLGAIGVILKPFDPLTLADQVRHILEARHGQ